MKLAEVKGVRRLSDPSSTVSFKKAFEVGKKQLDASKKEIELARRLVAASTLRF